MQLIWINNTVTKTLHDLGTIQETSYILRLVLSYTISVQSSTKTDIFNEALMHWDILFSDFQK